MLDSGTIQQGALSDKINGIQFSASYNVRIFGTHRETYILGTHSGQQRSGKDITLSPGTHVIGAQVAVYERTINTKNKLQGNKANMSKPLYHPTAKYSIP